MNDNFFHPNFAVYDPSSGRWTIERDPDGSYALYEPTGLRAATVHWDSIGRCWAHWDAPEEGEGVRLFAPLYACDVEALARVLSGARKPADVSPVDPGFNVDGRVEYFH